MTVSGIKVFQGLSVRNDPTFIDDKHSPDCGNVLINNPIGALSNIEGIEKYKSVGYGNPIVAIHQLNGHIFSLSGSKLYKGILAYPTLRTGLGTPTGTPITNVTELQAMNDDLTASYYLANAIDASATTGWNAGAGFINIGNSVNSFPGILDGNGYTITDLFINKDAAVGLFYKITGEVKNVGLIDVNITGHVGALSETGGLAANVFSSGIVSNCYVTGNVTGDYTGGLIGIIENTPVITNCYSTATITGTNPAGLGWRNGGTVNDCFWDTQTSGQTDGFGTGKTTLQMKTQSTYTNWDFTTIWEML